MFRSRSILFLLLAFSLFGLNAAAQTTGKNPVIIIPGVTGSQLVNPRTGKTVWFNIRRDKDDDVRLPMTSPILTADRDGLRVKDIIRTVKVSALPEADVYQTLIDTLLAKGYTEGNWNKPKATDVFYVFPYDWRRDNVESAHLLIQKMLAVSRAVKKPNLKFDILAHSMGGLIARYAAMYGMADLPRGGTAPVPNWSGAAHINKLMMFGTPNEGAFTAFDALLNGSPLIADRHLPFIDDLRPEDILSTPSSFQLLPHQSTTRFLDENLQPIKIDVYDPENWFKYGWGAITDPKFLSKLKDAATLARTNKDVKPVTPGPGAAMDDWLLARTNYAQVRAYFVSTLGRGRRFQLALDAPVKNTPIQLFAYGGNCEDTLDAVVLMHDEKKDRWVTLTDARDIKTSAGLVIKKADVKAAMFSPGDGRVTKRSLLAEMSASSSAGLAISTLFPLKLSFFACSAHLKLFLDKPIQDSYLGALMVEQHLP